MKKLWLIFVLPLILLCFVPSVHPLSTTPDWAIVETEKRSSTVGTLSHPVSCIGDVNGDGYSDVMTGVPKYSNGETNEGSIFMFYGIVSGLSNIANWTVESNKSYKWFGHSISPAGDVNGDGYSDVIASSFGTTSVYYGSITGPSTIANWTGIFWDVSNAGDVNGDGYSDIIMIKGGGPNNLYYFNAYYGGPSGLPASFNWKIRAPNRFAEYWATISSAGDVNGDGYSDVITGIYNNNPRESQPGYIRGKVEVYYGSNSGLSITSNWKDSSYIWDFGCRISCAGDVNGDGYSDVIVGADSQSFVYYGSVTGLSATANWTGVGAGCSAGDVNGDGYTDIITELESPPRSFVYYGSAAGLSITANWTVAVAGLRGWYLGTTIENCAGDVNSDGYSDIFIGESEFTGFSRALAYYGGPDGTTAPVITTHPASQTVAEGVTASFTVVATGSNLIYRWQKNNADIPGANSSTYTTSPTTLANNKATYRCVVSSGVSSILSKSATLTVKAPCPGDLDGDGRVTVADLFIVISHFGQTPVDAEWDPRADANKDDMVSFEDLTEVISNFGKECN